MQAARLAGAAVTGRLDVILSAFLFETARDVLHTTDRNTERSLQAGLARFDSGEKGNPWPSGRAPRRFEGFAAARHARCPGPPMSHPLHLDANDWAALNARRDAYQRHRACHAAEKGLFFGLRGRVFSCCFNKSHLLGTYPQDSIRDIWRGSAVALQRHALRMGDFSLGCAACLDGVKARNLEAVVLRQYDRFAAHNGAMPAKMDFELFNTCNLECIMCRGEFSSSIRENRENLPPIDSPYGPAFFDEVEAYIPSLKSSTFLGGEPFLIRQYVDLWDRMATLNPKMAISVQTNCTVLNKRIKDLMERIDFDVSVSIDSLVPDTYARIRKNGNLAQVMQNLRYFRDYMKRRGGRLTLVFCPMQQNWQELPALLAFCNEWDIAMMFATVESPPQCSLTTLSAEALDGIVGELRNCEAPDGTSLQAANRRMYLDQLAQLSAWANTARLRETTGRTRPPQDFAEFIEHIEQALLASGLHGRERCRAERDAIEAKLRFVLDHAAGQGRRAEAEARMIGFPPELIIRSIVPLSKEALLPLFSAYVMPLD